MSQPFDRKCCVPKPGKLDSELKEFWAGNPWDIVSAGHNLSCYERNRVYLNLNGQNFVEVSHLTGGADSDGDGRAAVAGDFRNNGQLDLVVRQVGGGALQVYENQFPAKHYLKVTLRGRAGDGKGLASNRQGIGSRLVAESGGRRVVREMYPHNSFYSQAPNIVHFGLGDSTTVERLTIRWPSGLEQVLKNVPADRHIVVAEGEANWEDVKPGTTIKP